MWIVGQLIISLIAYCAIIKIYDKCSSFILLFSKYIINLIISANNFYFVIIEIYSNT